MSSINNPDNPEINKGVELILRRRNPKKKTFSYNFDKMASLFNKDITISFNFSFDVRNNNQKE